VTLSSNCITLYKNGILVAEKHGANNLEIKKRDDHTIGRSNEGANPKLFKETIAFMNIYHGVEITPNRVKQLYQPHNTPHHHWDLTTSTPSSSVPDSYGDLPLLPFSPPATRFPTAGTSAAP